MKIFVKLLTLLMAGVLLLSLFASCGKDKTTPKDTDDGKGMNEDTGNGLYDEDGYLKDSLPESYNFNASFTIYTWDEMKHWDWCDELSSEPTAVDQALWNREQNVEERFGVDITRIYEVGNWGNRTAFISKLSNSIQGNDHEYDLVGQYTPCAGLAAVNGLYSNLKENAYLDFEKPWWPSSITETALVGDKLYFATGDITPTLIRNIQCMFVNTELYDSYRLSNTVNGRSIFEVVDDYDWTMETMLTMARNRVSVDEGNYGLSFLNSEAADAFFYGGGFSYIKNDGGIMALSDDLTNNLLINFFDQVQDLFTGEYADIAVTGSKPFVQSKSIFYAGDLPLSQELATEGVKFSLLPMPLLNESQQEYRTSAGMWVTMFGMPIDAKDPTMSGVIMEGLASEAYRTVSDEIYYNLFQMRYNGTNSDTARMFDVVSDSVMFDAARFFSDEIGIFAAFRDGVNNTKDGWSAIYDGKKDSWAKKVSDLYGKVG